MQRAEMPRPVRVLLVDDSAPVREAVASEFRPAPDFEIVGEAASLSEARGLLATVDVVILDLGLPDGSGTDLIRELRDANPDARAIVLTSAFDPAVHARAIEYGAAGVLDKITQLGHVAPAVRRILDMPIPVGRAGGDVPAGHFRREPPARAVGTPLSRLPGEHPGVRLDWRAVGFPVQGRSLLDGADVGVFVRPPREAGVCALTLDASPMVVVIAVGHRLRPQGTLSVADVLDEPFVGGLTFVRNGSRFGRWMSSADDRRSALATSPAPAGAPVVVARRAIATAPDWVASGLAHPGVVALPLEDGPPATTCLVWRDARRTHSFSAWSNSPQPGPAIVR